MAVPSLDRPPAARSRRLARYPRNAPAPVLVEVRRAAIIESRHRGHVVQVDEHGDVAQAVGDPDVMVTLRSAVKPFALVALVASGAADELRLSPSELAIMAASHGGEDLHVRTLQAVFRRAGISQTLLACGNAGGPLDDQTAARLARDGEVPSALRHNCSGFHTASLLLSRHAGWTLADYWRPDHPSQAAIRDAVAAAFGVPVARLQLGDDDCGVQTYAFPLVDVARAYRLLADPDSAHGASRRSIAPHLRRVRDAMMAAPEMVGGTNRMLDTQLMRLRPGALVSKGGAESLRGIGVMPDRGAGGAASAYSRVGASNARTRSSLPAPAGIAVKIEDGDGFTRANHAVTIEALRQLGVIEERDLADLGPQWHPVTRDPRQRIVAETIPTFELAPIAELS
jgi:L-asparaginase II